MPNLSVLFIVMHCVQLELSFIGEKKKKKNVDDVDASKQSSSALGSSSGPLFFHRAVSLMPPRG
jgi:hypothetical protein